MHNENHASCEHADDSKQFPLSHSFNMLLVSHEKRASTVCAYVSMSFLHSEFHFQRALHLLRDEAVECLIACAHWPKMVFNPRKKN